jgi:hypothetical protein
MSASTFTFVQKKFNSPSNLYDPISDEGYHQCVERDPDWPGEFLLHLVGGMVFSFFLFPFAFESSVWKKKQLTFPCSSSQKVPFDGPEADVTSLFFF